MSNAMRSILRQATRKAGDKVNILCSPTHERYQQSLATTNADFWMYQANGIKQWDSRFGLMPDNHHLIRPLVDGEPIQNPIPKWLEFDAVLTQSKQGQFQVHKQLANILHLPLISLEHTLPTPQWKQSSAILQQLKQMRGDINIFISEFSRNEWGWAEDEADIIYHGIDTDIFKLRGLERTPHILSVVNDWINRDWCCGFNLWRQSTQGLQVHPIGATPGLSLPAKSLDDLVNEYNTSMVFINTSLISPIPTSLLEAAACGCAIISTDNCAIGELIEHGVNGFLSNSPEGIRYHCQELLKNPALCAEFGMRARRTVKEKFNKETFVNKWNDVFERAANITFKG